MALQSSSIDEMKKFLINSYTIPNYQREFSWENNELEDFWNDLIFTCDEPNEKHFFGQIVVHNDSKTGKKYIIDGQQRTTTSMIFLRALQLHFKELYDSSTLEDADYNRTDIESNYLGRIKKRHLTIGEMDKECFENILTHSPETCIKEKKKISKSSARLKKAYCFFYDKISNRLDDDNAEIRLEILQNLFDTFIDRFMVLYMEATELEEAFVIFETLNARGRELETADLLKNYILNQSKDINSSLNKWNSMISNLDKCDPTKYIRAFWNATHAFSREKNLYRAISKEINTPKATRDLLNNLEQLSQSYHDMAFPNDIVAFEEKKLIRSLKSLKLLKASTFYPIVLAMKQKKFTESEIADVIKIIETLAFRNFTICGKTANTAETYFAEVAKRIYDESLESKDSICVEIRKEVVNDEEFADAFKRWSASRSAKDTVRYILRKIHAYLDKSNEINVDNMDVHIEHIMPEDNQKWKVPENIHESYLWRLGNLCLLSAPLNQGASNELFSVKEPYYLESKIEPNNEMRTYLKNGEWTKDSIEERQLYFTDLALKIWVK